MEDIKGAINIKKCDNCVIHFTRHGESLANIKQYSGIDSPLSSEGINQASKLQGHYNTIFISPMRRCFETLLYSRITYNQVVISYELRERIFGNADNLPAENIEAENDDIFWERVNQFHELLETECLSEKDDSSSKSVLIVAHAYFFNAWYMRACTNPPQNACIYNLV